MTFHLLSNLIVLDLSYNKLVTLYRNVFYGLNRLTTLNLKGFVIKSEHEENASFFGSQFSSLTNKGLIQQNIYESVNSFFNLLRVANISKSNVSILLNEISKSIRLVNPLITNLLLCIVMSFMD
jgi:hypothetical protein